MQMQMRTHGLSFSAGKTERHAKSAPKQKPAEVTGTFHFIWRKAMPAWCIYDCQCLWERQRDEMTDEQQHQRRQATTANNEPNETKKCTRTSIAMKHKILMHFVNCMHMCACVCVLCASLSSFWLPSLPSSSPFSFWVEWKRKSSENETPANHLYVSFNFDL